MRKQQLLQTQQLQIKLLSMQKKMMQLRTRYVIEVVTDKKVDQVRKTFRQFEYFNKILRKKLAIKDKQLYLGNHIRTTSKYSDLQFFINRLNSGYLIYKTINSSQQRRNASISTPTKNISPQLQLQPSKTKQLRSYLYDLLYKEDELFVDGVDDDDSAEQDLLQTNPANLTSIKAQFVKVQQQRSQDKKKKSSTSPSPTKNPFKRLWYASQADKALSKLGTPTEKVLDKIELAQVHALDLKSTILNDKGKPRQKSSEQGKFRNALKNIAYKASKAVNYCQNYAQTKNLKNILKNIEKCWIKFPNNYSTRDKTVVYRPYIWQIYEIRLGKNLIEFVNLNSVHKHRKVFIVFQADVQINFKDYTKLIIKNKIDKKPLQIRLSLEEQQKSPLTEQYLALYTHIKQVVKQQQQKFKMLFPSYLKDKVCNKVRIRIGLKQKNKNPMNRGNSHTSQNSQSSQYNKILQQKGSQIQLNFPHQQNTQFKKDHFEFKALKQISGNAGSLGIKITHLSIEAYVVLGIQMYVDIDFPIVDNFGALDIVVDQLEKGSQKFLPSLGSKQHLCQLHVPVQTIYKYMYNSSMPQKKKYFLNSQIKKKMIEIKHTKANFSLDYKCIGNYSALCTYNQDDIFEQDKPPQEFNRDQFRMNNNRLKRIIWSIQLYTQKLKDVKNFTYPNLSYLVYITLALACIFYNNNNYFLWLLISILLILFYNSPAYTVYIKDFTDLLKLQAKKKNLDVFLFKKNKLIEQQYVFPAKKQAKKQFLLQFKLTRKTKRSIYKKYKRLLQVLLQAQILLTKFVSFIEKLKNLFIWYHYEKTKLFFFILASMVFGLMILPIRFVMFLLILKQMRKGSKYHANIQDINRVIIIELVRIIIRQNNFVYIGEFFRDHFRPLDFKNAQTHIFFKTCNDLLSKWIQVKIQMDQISKNSVNMADFVKNLSKCKVKYKILPEICQKYGFNLEWSKTENSLKRFFDVIYGFIVTIPSDKYIMGVKTINNNDEQQMDEVENIIDRQLLNF